MADQPIPKVGDVINIPDGQLEGRVYKVDGRVVSLKDEMYGDCRVLWPFDYELVSTRTAEGEV